MICCGHRSDDYVDKNDLAQEFEGNLGKVRAVVYINAEYAFYSFIVYIFLKCLFNRFLILWKL